MIDDMVDDKKDSEEIGNHSCSSNKTNDENGLLSRVVRSITFCLIVIIIIMLEVWVLWMVIKSSRG